MSESAAGVYIAFGSDTLDTTPAYVAVNNVVSWSTQRGRQYELDKTQAGTATIEVIDQAGLFDPTNSTSPLYGNIGPLTPAQIRAVDPVTHETWPIFTGFVESWAFTVDKTERWTNVTIKLTDGFEILARAEVIPQSNGSTTYKPEQVNDRIHALLGDARWPAELTNIFTGNVWCQNTVYDPQASILGAIQDAADAEFPNVANVFMDKSGRVAFRGRWARFNPSFYSHDPPTNSKPARTWHVGDRDTAQTQNIAPISEIQWTRDLKNVINACLVTPRNIKQTQVADQLRPTLPNTFPTPSITKYGLRSFAIPDLIVWKSIDGPVGAPFPATNPGGDGVGDTSVTANPECQIFGQYYIDNYSEAVDMISLISFSSLDPSDSLAAPLWKFLTGVEIGDLVVITTHDAGGGGFQATQFFVEGIRNQVTNDLRGDVLAWVMNLDLTPRSWYSIFNGVTYYTP